MSERLKAVLVAVQLPGVDDLEFESSLVELGRLVKTLGYDVVGQVTQVRASPTAATLLGEGKLQELAELTSGQGARAPRFLERAPLRDDEAWDEEQLEADDEPAPPKIDLVAVDHEITPTQLRNLERATGVTVLDRTGIIIEIFHRHAKSREARLEVEMARLAYSAPRLRESGRGKERHHLRGSGDSALELDRRRIRDRIAELRSMLAEIQREQGVRREHRRGARRVALVGYTNAGKSSLMRALTGSSVYVEDKLFATLDTTVRALHPETKPRILVSDTVGFIKRLPHDLVASFKSTLDEAAEASLILHVVDASDPNWESQLEVTRDVLSEIGAGDVPTRLVMNKIDALSAEALADLRDREPDAWFVSAHSPAEVAKLREAIIEWFEASYTEASFFVPYDRQRLVSLMHENARVLEEKYGERGVEIRLRSDAETLGRLRAELG